MKAVLYTQRVEIIESYGEIRDCADRRIPNLIKECGYLPVPVPCIDDLVSVMIEQFAPVGIILTGGNSLVKYDGDAPERDKMEKALIETAVKKKIPVYGFCRGMQVILDYFGCKLVNIDGHIAIRHKVFGNISEKEVNSFHNQGCKECVSCLEILAQTEDGVIEAVKHKEYPILGTMWHPEREIPFRVNDIERIKKLFEGI